MVELFIPENNVVYPGQQLCKESEDLTVGNGVYRDKLNLLISSKMGYLRIGQKDKNKMIYIEELDFANKILNQKPELKLNDLIIGKVVSIDVKFAIIKIIAINERKISHVFEGMIKREHMGNKNIDKIRVENVVTPGDYVIARVKSLSESKKVLLSIQDDDLGVILSFDENSGDLLEPLNQFKTIRTSDNKEFHKKMACL